MAETKSVRKAKPRAKKASGETGRPTKTKAQKAQDAIDKALKGLKKDQREKVLSNYVTQPEAVIKEVKVEERNEHVEELTRVFIAYRAGSETSRALESAVRKVTGVVV